MHGEPEYLRPRAQEEVNFLADFIVRRVRVVAPEPNRSLTASGRPLTAITRDSFGEVLGHYVTHAPEDNLSLMWPRTDWNWPV